MNILGIYLDLRPDFMTLSQVGKAVVEFFHRRDGLDA